MRKDSCVSWNAPSRDGASQYTKPSAKIQRQLTGPAPYSSQLIFVSFETFSDEALDNVLLLPTGRHHHTE